MEWRSAHTFKEVHVKPPNQKTDIEKILEGQKYEKIHH